MARELVGYGHLIEKFNLPARQLASMAIIDSATKGRQRSTQGDTESMLFEPRYRPKPTTVAHLQFARELLNRNGFEVREARTA